MRINKCFSFDWDDNILHMPTKIKMDKKVGEDSWEQLDVEPAEFALIRNDKENYRIRNNDPLQAFDEFIDFGPRGDRAFIEDVKIALERGDFAPSWSNFKNCLLNGNLFSIVTSRSHEYSSIRKAIELIINEVFTAEERKQMFDSLAIKTKVCYPMIAIDFSLVTTNHSVISDYLDACKYYGVGIPFSESFKSEFGIDDTHKISIQEAKKMALDKFISICKDAEGTFTLGFSDDDKKTTELIKEFFKTKSSEHPEAKLFVYDTSDRNIIGGSKTKYVAGIQH